MIRSEVMALMQGVVLLLLLTVGAGLAAWLISRVIVSYRQQKMARLQAEVLTKFLDKIGTSEELTAWLESGGARRLFEVEPSGRQDPYNRILGAMQAGVILTALGVALLFLASALRPHVILFISGTLVLAAGLGFLVSTGLSYYFSKSWGLLKKPDS